MYNQTRHNQAVYAQAGHHQVRHNQAVYAQAEYHQVRHNQTVYDQLMHNQVVYHQAGKTQQSITIEYHYVVSSLCCYLTMLLSNYVAISAGLSTTLRLGLSLPLVPLLLVPELLLAVRYFTK